MACLEHKCLKCGEVWFDNSVARRCQGCGSNHTVMCFDEDDDRDTPEPDYDDEDDDP
jgi:predicted  nucleic acid-binding Zn-ribbon protein